MRDFINGPNGQSKQSVSDSERNESDRAQSPLVGKTV